MSGFDNTSYTTRTVTGTTDTLLATDFVVIYSSTSAKAVSIPAISALTPGRMFCLVNTAAGALTTTPAGGATVNGAATFVTPAGTAAGAGRTWFVNDGTNWFTIVGNTTS